MENQNKILLEWLLVPSRVWFAFFCFSSFIHWKTKGNSLPGQRCILHLSWRWLCTESWNIILTSWGPCFWSWWNSMSWPKTLNWCSEGREHVLQLLWMTALFVFNTDRLHLPFHSQMCFMFRGQDVIICLYILRFLKSIQLSEWKGSYWLVTFLFYKKCPTFISNAMLNS